MVFAAKAADNYPFVIPCPPVVNPQQRRLDAGYWYPVGEHAPTLLFLFTAVA